jgi:peptidoglycan/LPS O-acetylase OafA/YrhL
MTRKRVLQIVLGILGSLFLMGLYALTQWDRESVFPQMLASVYATLGLFLLLAIRNPSSHRSLISFTAWSSFAHGAVMAVQVVKNLIPRIDWLRAVLPLFVIGVLLIVLAPPKESQEESRRGSAGQPLRSAPPEVARP